MDNADERIGTLACRRAKLTSVNVVNENYQGLGTEGSETPHLGDLNFLKKKHQKTPKIRSWHWISIASRGPQSDGRHPFLYDVATHVVDKSEICDV